MIQSENNMKMRFLLVSIAVIAINSMAQKKQPLSHSFELRYITTDTKANGETDYKGATEWMNTDQRVEYLTHWAKYATRFFNDQTLAEQVVDKEEVVEAMKRLKPQPLPQVRQKIVLDEWRWASEGHEPAPMTRCPNEFEPQTWRFRLEMDITGEGKIHLMNGKTIVCEYKNDGNAHHALFEVDLTTEERRYNLRLDGRLIVDFQPLMTKEGPVDGLKFEGGIKVDNVWGLGYAKTSDAKRLNQPMFAKTFIDWSSKHKPNTQGWPNTDYDDSQWETCQMPKNHGTERHEGEALLLRKWVKADDFERAYFELESLFPSGELWVNGKVVEVMKNSHRQWVDITKYLKPNANNLLALRIDPFIANFKQMMHHCPTDPNIGWFAGRCWLHLTKATRISDLYVYTTEINDNDAEVTAEVTVTNDDYNFYEGRLQLLLKDWFPTEGTELMADSIDVSFVPQETKTYKLHFTIKDAHLWSCQHPQLYQVRALLINNMSGTRIETFSAVDGDLARTRELHIDRMTDDYAVTTGLRTIDQDGGTFRINRKPELLRAPLYFGQRFPLETNALNLLSPHSEDIMRELLAVKKMNGNGMRMSAHWSDDSTQDGTNDPRFAEMADQLGLMFIWQTASWIRLRSPLVADFEGMAKDVRQLRNAPSIVIWQPSNHPSLTKWHEVTTYWHKVYDAIYPNDTTRLITPTADFRHTIVRDDSGMYGNDRQPVSDCDPIWTANRISRGSMDYPTGFGQDWEYLRRWPFPHKWKGNPDINSFLTSKQRAYFNFEQEETIGQMNWDMFKGQPMYKFHSYEWDYDEGSIGRLLSFEEWRESQAWQAFSAYECIRKMRWLDYDGLSWCCMWGGGNMGTYQKPLIDGLGHKKLAWYAHRMGFQQILAGSKDVDIVYGPDDKPGIVVMNLGDSQLTDIIVTVRNSYGHEVYKQEFKKILLPAGRTATDAGRLKLPPLPEGYYFFDYKVKKR